MERWRTATMVKFSVGDWVMYKHCFGYIAEITDDYIIIECGDEPYDDRVWVWEHEYKYIEPWAKQ